MLRLLRYPVCLALMACGGGGSSTAPGPTPTDVNAPRDTLVIAVSSDIDSLNPVVASNARDSDIIDAINVPLIDASFDCSIKKRPALATEWSWSEDGKILSMTLRDDLFWQDGQKVTPEDIAFTYALLSDPLVATPRARDVAQMTLGGRPKIIDSTHIEWHFTQAYDRDAQVAHADLNLVPKHILEKADRSRLKGDPFSKNPVGNGPWKLATYEPGQRIVLEPNEKFSGPAEMKPKLNRVIFRVIPEYSTRLGDLRQGTVDMMSAITVADADLLRKSNPNINLVRRGFRFMDYVVWNEKDPRFADKKVRQALAYSADVDDLIAKLLTGETGEAFARRAVGNITPELCGVHNDEIVPLPHDVERARALFAEAGWKDTDKDGFLDRDGQKFSFTLLTNAENKRRGDAAIRLQAQFKDVGVEMNITPLDFNTVTDRLHHRDFEAALSGWSAGLFVDPSSIFGSDTPERQTEFNYGSYSNPGVDELMAKGLAAPNPEDAAPIWKEFQAVLYDDQPYLFLWWMDEIVGLDSRFSKYNVNLMSDIDDLHEWEVPADKVKYKH